MPCKVLKANTPIEKLKEIAIKDNVSVGEDDWDLLANEWNVGTLNDWGMDIPDFKDELSAVDDDFNGVAPKEPITVLGDLYEIGEHRLLCGDSTQTDTFEKLFNGQYFDRPSRSTEHPTMKPIPLFAYQIGNSSKQ